MRFPSLLLLTIFVASCSASAGPVDGTAGEMGGNFGDEISTVLFVDPATVTAERQAFIAELRTIPARASKRELYEKYVPVIGANGVLEGITQLWPTCHSEAHDLGKVIQATINDIGTSLRVCRDGCYSGCMHGVLMEAFAGARTGAENDPERHVDVELVKTMLSDLCARNETMTAAYSPGDCAHGVGHALMVLSDYRIPETIRYCDGFGEDHLNYYCATGAYMEYVTERDAEDVATGKREFYPCDVGKYPAACARYKMVHVIPRNVKSRAQIGPFLRKCAQLTGKYRVGCYHGAGNGFMGPIVQGKVTLLDVCGGATGDDRFACIEGAIERMVKYHPDLAKKTCATVQGSDRETCDDAIAHGMYNMEKDMSLYAH